MATTEEEAYQKSVLALVEELLEGTVVTCESYIHKGMLTLILCYEVRHEKERVGLRSSRGIEVFTMEEGELREFLEEKLALSITGSQGISDETVEHYRRRKKIALPTAGWFEF